MSAVENFCPYMCDHSSMCFWKCYNFRKFSGHVKIKPFSASGGCAPRPPLPDSPITSVSGPGMTMLLVTPLTIGAAHSLYDTFCKIPSASNRSSSLSMAHFKAKGRGRALQNLGLAPGLSYNVVSKVFIWPNSSTNTFLCVCKRAIICFCQSIVCPGSEAMFKLCQFNLMWWGQFLLIKLGPLPLTTYNSNYWTCLPCILDLNQYRTRGMFHDDLFSRIGSKLIIHI